MAAPRPDLSPLGKDFPVQPDARGWGLLLLSLLGAYQLLLWLPATHAWSQFLVRLLFAGMPLAAWAWVARPQAGVLFGPFGWRQALAAVLTAILAMAAALVAALLVSKFALVSPNPLAFASAGMALPDFVWQLVSMLPQLLGEELLTVLPFLALVQLASTRWGWGRRSSLLLALVGSTLLFSAAHLPTYNWHWAQCFCIIGASRVVLTLAYIATRNLWVTAAAHILMDWTEFTLVFLVLPGHAR